MPTPPDARLARWIRRELSAERLRAPSLIATLWGDAIATRAEEVWLATLFRLLAPFGVNERAARTGMFRLTRGGWFEARPVGRRSRYRLTAKGAEGFGRAFHRVYDPPFAPWDGEWEGVMVDTDHAGSALRRRLHDELAWSGYGRFQPGLYLRPAHRDGAAERIAAALDAIPAITAFVARDAAGVTSATLSSRTASVWSLDELAGNYRRFIARFGAIGPALTGNMDPEQAFVVRILLVHAYRRARLRDPQLPREVLASHWPGAAAYELSGAVFARTLQPSQAHLDGTFAACGEPDSPGRPAPPGRFLAPKPMNHSARRGPGRQASRTAA